MTNKPTTIAPCLYLETSVWGSLAPRQPRDRAQVVHRLLRLLDGVHGTCVISDVVEAEINNAPPDEAAAIRSHLDRRQPLVYPISRAMESLAQSYIEADVLPNAATPTPCTSRPQPAFSSTTW